MNTEVSRLLSFAYFYLRFRPRTEKEMMEYLEKKIKRFHFSIESVGHTLAELKNQKLIDDGQFIEWYIQVKGSSRKKSVALLKNELRLKGIEGSMIADYFEEHPVDELAGALKALRGQWRRFADNDTRRRFEKSATFLQRKGFSYPIIKRAIADLEEKE